MANGKKARKLFQFIEEYIIKNHIAPTYDEMLVGCGFKSKSNIGPYLQQLKHAGRIDYIEGSPRAIWLAIGNTHTVKIIKRGSISAGSPIPPPEADNLDADWLPVTMALLPNSNRPSELFALRVDGDSMIDASVEDGDWVILAPPRDIRQGDMVAAWIIDEQAMTLKKYFQAEEQVMLVPANPKYSARHKHQDQVEFQGKVLCVIRSYDK